MTLGMEMICDCGHKLGWHHAKMKYQGKERICFGIACMCTTFNPDKSNGDNIKNE